MNISVIFPTYQRVNDLRVALDSLLEQTLLPYEVIVVDQSDDDETKKLCFETKYKELNINYIYSDCKSPPKAKQIWMENISNDSEIMIFFDDDVKLDSRYLEEVSSFMSDNTTALWGWWLILNLPHKKSFIEDLWYKLFRTPKISHEFCTTDAQYKDSEKTQNVLSIIWCNMFFRSNLSKKYSFVDWMRRYWHADDTFFTYQISKDNPNSLYYIPSAKLYHFESPAWRILKTQKFNQVLYHRYIFWKKYSFSMLTYYWWSFGFLIWTLLKSDNKFQVIKEYFKTLRIIWKYWKEFQANPIKVNDFIYN